MFLLICSHSMDDIPLQLFATLDEAIAEGNALFARAAAEWKKDILSEELTPAYWKTDASTPICLDIVEFGADGKPTKCGQPYPPAAEWSFDDIVVETADIGGEG